MSGRCLLRASAAPLSCLCTLARIIRNLHLCFLFKFEGGLRRVILWVVSSQVLRTPKTRMPMALTNVVPVTIILTGNAAVDVRSGLRSPLMGFVISASRILQGMSNDPPRSTIKNPSLKRALQGDARWAAFVEPTAGAFHKLCAEQDAELGGPRPSASDMIGDMTGGGLMSSQDILALIESMNLGGS